jgi:hypothetical protein
MIWLRQCHSGLSLSFLHPFPDALGVLHSLHSARQEAVQKSRVRKGSIGVICFRSCLCSSESLLLYTRYPISGFYCMECGILCPGMLSTPRPQRYTHGGGRQGTKFLNSVIQPFIQAFSCLTFSTSSKGLPPARLDQELWVTFELSVRRFDATVRRDCTSIEEPFWWISFALETSSALN